MWRIVLVSMLVVSLAGAAVVALDPGKDGGGASSTSNLPDVLDLRPGAVRQLLVSSDSGRAELVRLASGNWTARPGTPAETIPLLEGFEDRLFPLKAFRRIPTDHRNPEYGLTQPELRVEVTARGGRRREVLLGEATFTGGGFYAYRKGERGVFLVARRVMDDLRSLAKGERVDSPRSAAELERLRRAEQRVVTAPEVISPWLQQTLEAGAVVPEGVVGE